MTKPWIRQGQGRSPANGVLRDGMAASDRKTARDRGSWPVGCSRRKRDSVLATAKGTLIASGSGQPSVQRYAVSNAGRDVGRDILAAADRAADQLGQVAQRRRRRHLGYRRRHRAAAGLVRAQDPSSALAR